MIARLLAVTGMLLAAGCAGPTEYVRLGTDWKGGYDDSQLKPDVFLVTFKGNAVIGRERAQSYLLYRCAELTRQQGYDHFVLVEGTDSSSAIAVATVGAGIATATADTKPELTVRIKLGRGPAPTDDDNAYDALVLLRALDDKVPRDYDDHPRYP